LSGQRLVLLGDSILDNAPYTTPDPDTTTHLCRLLAPSWGVELLAQDGARMSDVRHQLAVAGRPAVAILSIGGNDAIEHLELLAKPASSSADVLNELVAIADAFASRYQAVAGAVADRAGRVILCTIYEVPLEPPALARLARVPLALLNDRIIRTGARLGLDVLELRSVCTEAADFTWQIEPSARGAEKIANAIAAVLRDVPGLGSARVFSA
jgi:lysophospholipase L1-like esterase